MLKKKWILSKCSEKNFTSKSIIVLVKQTSNEFCAWRKENLQRHLNWTTSRAETWTQSFEQTWKARLIMRRTHISPPIWKASLSPVARRKELIWRAQQTSALEKRQSVLIFFWFLTGKCKSSLQERIPSLGL